VLFENSFATVQHELDDAPVDCSENSISTLHFDANQSVLCVCYFLIS
jgi:hypothetical protein